MLLLIFNVSERCYSHIWSRCLYWYSKDCRALKQRSISKVSCPVSFVFLSYTSLRTQVTLKSCVLVYEKIYFKCSVYLHLYTFIFSGLLVFFCVFAIKYGADSLIQMIDGIQAKYEHYKYFTIIVSKHL